jgi:GDPmannose 4,6-dehydratase
VRECLSNVQRKFGGIDQIYLIAAMSHVGNSFSQKEYSIMANGQSCYYFLEWLKQNSKNTRTYFAGTSELAGNVPEGTFFNEKNNWNPKSPYALGKQLGVGWIKLYRESLDSQLFACFGILFNHSNYFRSEDFYIARVCSYAAKIAHGQEKELTLGNLNFWRDEHFSCFGVEMMTKMLEQDQPEDFVVGAGKTYHGEEYLDEAFKYFNLDWKNYVKIDDDRKRPNEVVRLIADSTKAQEKLGWNPNRMTFQQHIGEICNFWDHKVQNKYFELPNIWKKYNG